MGSRFVKFEFTPEENEQIEVNVKLPEEPRSVIHGIVRDHKNKLVKDAVVKLFEVTSSNKPCAVKPITHTFTDDCGQFLFGPLCPHKRYLIKIWVNDIKIRPMNVDFDCDDPCDPKHHYTKDEVERDYEEEEI